MGLIYRSCETCGDDRAPYFGDDSPRVRECLVCMRHRLHTEAHAYRRELLDALAPLVPDAPELSVDVDTLPL